jgi:hypothetical protein
MALKIALLADLAEPVHADARTAAAALAFDLAEALAELSGLGGLGETSVELFASRGSWRGLPLVSLDPGEVARPPAHPLDHFATQEALITQLVLAGMLQGYDLVHCFAPVVAPLQMIAALGIPIVQTLTVPAAHPAAKIAPLLIPPRLLRQAAIPPGVDTVRYHPLPSGEDAGYALWLGTGRRAAAAAAAADIAAALGLPLVSWGDAEPAALLQHARVLLHLDREPAPSGAIWPLRALACGIPVAGWQGGGLDAVLDRPGLGALAPPGDVAALAAAFRALPDRREAALLRRRHVLGRYGRRALAGRYRELYRELAARPAS